jgi:DNA polymerase III subunit epsilon
VTPWWEQGFVVLDTETDSADPEQARLASIYRAAVNPAQRSKDVRSALVAIEMPAEASAVNGLTTEQLMAEGKPPADVLDEYCADIASSLALGVPVVAANAPFDLTVLDRDCRRNGVPTITDRLAGTPLGPIVDPIVLDEQVVPRRRRVSPTQGARCLKALAQVHGVGWDDDLAHTAEYDALQAGRVVWQLMRRFSYLASLTLGELHTAQVRWYAEQSESLSQFFRRTGNQREFDAGRATNDAERAIALDDAEQLRVKADGVSPHWPMRPFGGAA